MSCRSKWARESTDEQACRQLHEHNITIEKKQKQNKATYQAANLELDVSGKGSGLDINLDGVMDVDFRAGVADGASIVGDHVGNGGSLAGREGVAANGGLLGGGQLSDFAQLVLGLLLGDAVEGETSLHVIQQAVMLVGLFQGDDVCSKTTKTNKNKIRNT